MYGTTTAVHIRRPRSVKSSLTSKTRFPNASIRAASLTDIAQAIQPHAARLPVITAEIGDNWIYGVPSDPAKVARFRELLRLRRQWVNANKWQVASHEDIAFLRSFALGAEHTWGADTKTWLDFDHYTPDALVQMLDTPKYQVMVHSWAEKRDDIQKSLRTLPSALREEVESRFAALKPVRPVKKQRAGTAIANDHLELGLDERSGAIVKLRNKRTNTDWATPEHPLALFSYQTLSKSDYDRFLAQFITVQNEWAPKDFGKPNIQQFGAESRLWNSELVESFVDGEQQLLARMRVGAGPASGAPQEVYLEVSLSNSEPTLNLNLSWFGKRSNRLPEAIWLSFKPNAPDTRNWRLEKMGELISPFDVISGGNRHMHALSSGLQYKDGNRQFAIESVDAPVVSLGVQTPIYFSREQPDLAGGFHFSLFNNGWGTNYIQWFGEDMRFRFVIRA